MSNDSISVILPVHDYQREILPQIEQLLDDLAELSNSIELILVDDGSKDATPELLEDARLRFPQIRVHRNPQRMGPVEAAQGVVQKASGDLVFVHESYEPIDIEQLKQLWRLRLDRQLIVARAKTRSNRIDQTLMQRLSEWGSRIEASLLGETKTMQGLQMIRREAMEVLASDHRPEGDLEVSHVSHHRIAGPKFAELGSARYVSKSASSKP